MNDALFAYMLGQAEPRIPPHRCDLVIQGGGAKGLTLAWLLALMLASGYRFRRIIGTSVGAILAAALRTMTARVMVDHFESITTAGVMRKGPEWWAYVQLRNHTGMYSWHPLRDLLHATLPARELAETWVVRADTETRKTESVLAQPETVYESALMPLIGRFSKYCDGGVRDMLPIGKGLDRRLGDDGVPLVILMTQPVIEPDGEYEPPRNGLQAIPAVMDMMMREVARTDLRPFLDRNHAVKEAGRPVPRPDGRGFWRYIPFELWAPAYDLGDAMDFDRAELKDLRREAALEMWRRGPYRSAEEIAHAAAAA